MNLVEKFQKVLIALGGKTTLRKKLNYDNVFIKKYKIIKLFGLKFSFSYPPIMGDNNKIILTSNNKTIRELKEWEEIPGFDIIIEGNNNIIKLDAGNKFHGCSITIKGDNNKITIENSPHVLHNIYVQMNKLANNRQLHIKKNLYCWSATLGYASDDNVSITIGENCVFSSGVVIRCADGHPIYDLKTKSRLNPDKDTIIGDKVWIMQDAKILKGVNIPSNCAIGANSFVNKSIGKTNCIIAGNPAKVCKENIFWERLTQKELVDAQERERERE